MIIIGHALEELKRLESKSVNCCVTSPPYWGLRDYGHPGQLGLEKTPDEYVEKMVEIFREVSRVLRDDGTLWLNLGDSYMSNPNPDDGDKKYMNGRQRFDRPNTKRIPGIKQKDLVGIPWRVAFALQDDGWYLRQDIIWAKPNPMPESVKDRCTKAHEYIFLMSKNPKYYFDNEAIKEPAGEKGNANSFRGGCYVNGNIDNATMGKRTVSGNTKKRPSAPKGSFNGKTEAMAGTGQNAFRAVTDMRNKRSVWTVSTKPYKGAHFATFPPDLIEPCILAGCPSDGVVIDPFCGSGTVGAVAKKSGRDFILIELNPEYKPLIDKRLESAHYQSSF